MVDALTELYGMLIVEDYVAFGDYAWDICSDDLFRAGDHAEKEAIETFTFDAGNAQLKAGWSWKYKMISRANNILMHVPEMNTISETLKKEVWEKPIFSALLPIGGCICLMEKCPSYWRKMYGMPTITNPRQPSQKCCHKSRRSATIPAGR